MARKEAENKANDEDDHEDRQKRDNGSPQIGTEDTIGI